MNVTQLARGTITNADELLIELIESPGSPPIIRLRWPDKPSVCTPAQLDSVVAATMRVLANSVVELAAIKGVEKAVDSRSPASQVIFLGVCEA